MPELRWILLGLGALFCIGLWWWETRRPRQAADTTSSLRPADPYASAAAPLREPRRRAESALPIDPTRADSVTPEPDVAAHQTATFDPDTVDLEESAPPASESIADEATTLAAGTTAEWLERKSSARQSFHLIDEVQASPVEAPPRLEPTVGNAAAVVAPRPGVEPPAGTPPPKSLPEKIVTIRLAAPPLERFDGRALILALSAAGLVHGRFSIFHRLGEDGSTTFSVASLVEPGTFDLDAIEGRRFPGVSFFTVLRSREDVAVAFEDMLNTARHIAGQLNGTLQDEYGSPLSPHRLAELREDIAAWHRSAEA